MSEYTSEVGQTLFPDSFEIALGVQEGSPRGTHVTDLIKFLVLLQLSEERLIKLEVTAKATFKTLPFNNVLVVWVL